MHLSGGGGFQGRMSFRPETHEKRGDLLYLSPARREGARYWSRSDARLKGISLASDASDNSGGPGAAL